MIKKFGIFILLIFLLSEVSSSCNETQIDINTASAEELDKISQIGPVTADEIIKSRPFNSLDDLLNVSGIGEKKLEKIKAQELACVNEETANDNQEETDNTEATEIYPSDKTTKNAAATETPEPINNSKNEPQENIILAPISLNAQNIKSENNNENLGKNLPLYGIIGFCVLFGALFFLKFVRRKRKNEFR